MTAGHTVIGTAAISRPMIVCSLAKARPGAVAQQQSRKIRFGSREDSTAAKLSVEPQVTGMPSTYYVAFILVLS